MHLESFSFEGCFVFIFLGFVCLFSPDRVQSVLPTGVLTSYSSILCR